MLNDIIGLPPFSWLGNEWITHACVLIVKLFALNVGFRIVVYLISGFFCVICVWEAAPFLKLC